MVRQRHKTEQKITEGCLTDRQKEILRQCLWDLNLEPEEFYAILTGRLHRRWPSQAFCVARLVESVNWFKILEVIEPTELCRYWSEEAKHLVRSEKLKEGMDFVCRLLSEGSLPPTG